MTDNRPKRTFRQKVTIAIVAVGALLIGAVAGNVGRTLINHFIQNPEVENRPNVVEQDSNQPENSASELQGHVDPKIQSELKDLENQLRHLYGELDSLGGKLDSYRKAAGIGGRRVTYTQSDVRELQSDLRKLQESVKANYQSIQRITNSRYGREFVTLGEVQSLIRSIPKVSDREIRDVVERTLRDYRLTGPGAYGTVERTVNDIRRDIDRIDQSMRDMQRGIDDLKRKVD